MATAAAAACDDAAALEAAGCGGPAAAAPAPVSVLTSCATRSMIVFSLHVL